MDSEARPMTIKKCRLSVSTERPATIMGVNILDRRSGSVYQVLASQKSLGFCAPFR